MDNIKFGIYLVLVLAVAGSTGVAEPKRDALLKLEGIETPELEAPRNNASERGTHVSDDRRGRPDVLLQILGLKERPTTTKRPYYPTPPWHPPKPTHKPHPPPYPHYPYPPYNPYYPYYPYWYYPPYPYPPYPHPTRWPTPAPTSAPTPSPTPPPTCVRPEDNPNGELAPPSQNCPPPPTMGRRELSEQYEPIYQLRTDDINDDDEADSSESVLKKVHKKKRRLYRQPTLRPHIMRINTNSSA